jgi:tripartite-type tricarboxylate transporter receptor subunit TctC
MKKFVTLMLVALMVFSVAACTAETKKVDWPTKTVQLICPYGAGGDTDTYCRAMADLLSKHFGRTFIVVNQTGGSGIVAAKNVMAARNDGYTILFNHTGASLTQEATGVADFSYTNDFANACTVAQDNTYVFVCKAEKGWKNLDDLKAAALAAPGKIRYSQVYGSLTHYVCSQLEEMLGIELDKIDVGTSAGDRLAAALGDHVDVLAANYMNVTDYIENGAFNVLGICSLEPLPGLENQPTCASQGYPVVGSKNYEMKFPKSTNPEIVKALSNACKELTASQGFADTLSKYYAQPFYRDSETTNTEDLAQVEELKKYFK